MFFDFTLKIIEIVLQMILAFFAWKALSIWKSEIRGRDKYQQSKDLLEYIKKLRFLIHGNKGSWHQIYLNDIITDKEKFYKDQLFFIAKEKAYFTSSYFTLFNHINSRSDIFLEKEIRLILESLTPVSMMPPETDKAKSTYIELINEGAKMEGTLKMIIFIFSTVKNILQLKNILNSGRY